MQKSESFHSTVSYLMGYHSNPSVIGSASNDSRELIGRLSALLANS